MDGATLAKVVKKCTSVHLTLAVECIGIVGAYIVNDNSTPIALPPTQFVATF